MLNIGMVGAENSHTAAIAKVVNIQKRIPGVRATHVWGETRAFARAAAEAGDIPEIVRDPSDMIGRIEDNELGSVSYSAGTEFKSRGIVIAWFNQLHAGNFIDIIQIYNEAVV